VWLSGTTASSWCGVATLWLLMAVTAPSGVKLLALCTCHAQTCPCFARLPVWRVLAITSMARQPVPDAVVLTAQDCFTLRHYIYGYSVTC
jgi:hypothetical protein